MKDKQRLAVLFSLGVIVLTLVLFALPGQFVTIYGYSSFKEGDLSAMGGFQFIFGGSQYLRNNYNSGDPIFSATGIAFLVLLVGAVVCYVFHKKTTALLLLAGIVMFVVTIMLFCVRSWIKEPYKTGENTAGLWVPYLSASLLALSTIATFYVAIRELIEESRQPYTPKKETYSYLKNK